MQGNPMDLFDEMDEVFARLFSRNDWEFMDGFPHLNGCCIMIRDNRDRLEGSEVGT
jgi:hypothetical protein